MISENFINECKNRANKNRLGKLIVDGLDNPITNSNNLKSLSITSGCYVSGNIIGSIYVECLTGELLDTANINLVDKTVQAQIGVKYADLSNEYISMGKYTVEHPNDEITANMSQFTAYSDLINKIDNRYVCGIDYSEGNKTVSDLYIDVCSQLGLIPTTTTFINSTIPILDNPFTAGEKNRTVLQTIAKISSSFVDIDNDTNEIDLCWLSQNIEPDYTFYKNDYVSVDGGKVVCGPINCLIIKNSQIDDENVTIKDEESIALYGEHSIIISEDYILYNAELRQQAITSIWDRVHGMRYVDCKLTTYYGKPFLKLGNKIRVYTSETEYFDTYVLKHVFTYDGTFASVIESPALTEQEIKTKQDVSLGEQLSLTQIEMNKQKKTIDAVVSTQDEQQESITQLTLTQEGIESTVATTQEIINNNYQELNKKFDGYAPVEDVITLENSVVRLQTDTYTKTEVNTKLTDGSVTKVITTAGTFDEEGLTIEKTDAPTKGKFSYNGMTVIDNTGSTEKELLFAGYDNDIRGTVVRSENLQVKKYFIIGANSRLEDYEGGTGVFDI